MSVPVSMPVPVMFIGVCRNQTLARALIVVALGVGVFVVAVFVMMSVFVMMAVFCPRYVKACLRVRIRGKPRDTGRRALLIVT